ncbi:MAG: hypothetical protein GVY30_12485 [Chloroflexi bacterium]|nr:hypothetical protein [Chloroflexota bacterium]
MLSGPERRDFEVKGQEGGGVLGHVAHLEAISQQGGEQGGDRRAHQPGERIGSMPRTLRPALIARADAPERRADPISGERQGEGEQHSADFAQHYSVACSGSASS